MIAGYKIAVVVICAILAAIFDICFMYCLHHIALWIACPESTERSNCLHQRLYNYLRRDDKDKHQNHESAQQLFSIDHEDDKSAPLIISREPDESQFIVTKNHSFLWSLFAECSLMKLYLKSLAIWNILCGLLAIILLIATLINVAFQFLVTCYLNHWTTLLFGSIMCIFIFPVMHRILNHAFSAVLLFWWNTCNVARTNCIQFCRGTCNVARTDCIQFVWGVAHLVVWIIYIVVFTKKSSKEIDRIFWRKLLEWMIVRGIIWISLFELTAFGTNIATLYQIVKDKSSVNAAESSLFAYQRQPSKHLSYLSWEYMFFDLTTNNMVQNRLSPVSNSIQCIACIKYMLCPVFFITVITFFAIALAMISRAFLFAAITMLMFYFFVWVFDKIDFDSVYCIWSGKYHKEIMQNLTEFWNRSEQDNKMVGYFDLWALFASEKQYQYWCGFKCLVDSGYLCTNCKIHKQSLFKPCCQITCWLAPTTILFIYYIFSISMSLIPDQTYDGKKMDWDKVNELIPYPMCETLDIEGIDVLDLVYLTKAIYFPDNLTSELSTWFNPSYKLNISYIYNPKGQESTFAHIQSGKGLDLIVVRGTKTSYDAIEDFSLWSEIFIVQLISKVLPIESLTSVDFLRLYVYCASFAEGIIEPKLRTKYSDSVYQYIKQNMSKSINDEDKTVVILGHSLGGGVAQIVAAKLLNHDNANNIYSFGLASPGTKYTSKKFDFSVNSLYESSISVLPERDIVSQIDSHGGEVQDIKCNGKHFWDCHYATTNFCSIAQNCGRVVLMEEKNKRNFVNCVCGNQTHHAKQWDMCWK